MANQISNVGFTDPYAAEQSQIERRRALAGVLQQQSMQPIEQQQAGGWTVPISPWQGAAKMAQAYVAALTGRKADEQQRELGQRQQERRSADLKLLAEAARGRPASPGGLTEDPAGNITRADPMAAQTPSQSLQQALPMMQDPGLQQMGLGAMMQQMKPQEGYTLGPGAQRFGPDNQPLAQAPFKPEQPQPFTLSPGATRYGPGGEQIAQAPKPPEPFTLAPGGVRYGPDGKPIAQSPVAPKAIVDINTKGEGKYAEVVAGKSGERDIGQHDAAQAAVENIAKLDLTLKQITESDAITGMGAELFKNFERAKQLVMRDEASGKKVSDTELLDSLLGSDVFPMIKALGIGARGLDTPAEREFLRQVMTGTIPMNKETLRRMTQIRRDVAKRAIERWNDRVETGELDRYFSATGMPKRKVDIPKAAPTQSTPVTQGGGFQEGQTATGPGGQRIIFRGGQWQPISP